MSEKAMILIVIENECRFMYMYVDKLLNVNTFKLNYNPINWDKVTEHLLNSIPEKQNDLYRKTVGKYSRITFKRQ